MSRTSDLAYRAANEPATLTADERATVAAMRRQSNAYDRARQQAELGNRPVLVATTVTSALVVKETWRVMSRSHDGHAYFLELSDHGRDDGRVGVVCNCEAGGQDRWCWHVCAVTAAHNGSLPHENEAGYKIRAKRVAITAAMLSGKG